VQRKYVGFFDQERSSASASWPDKWRHPVLKQGTQVRHGGRLNPPRHSGTLIETRLGGGDGWGEVTRDGEE
jgi:hypothetical protein